LQPLRGCRRACEELRGLTRTLRRARGPAGKQSQRKRSAGHGGPLLRICGNAGRGRHRRVLRRAPRLSYSWGEMNDMRTDILAGDGNRVGDGDPGLGVATKTRTRTKTPSPYKVLMLNDDYTPMEFVVQVLQSIFRMNIEDATRVMLHVHQRGVGVCGIFPYEVA